MGVGLQPLEFTECLADSPQFRENLQRHEKELERTSQQIKRLIKEVKDVVQAAKRLGQAQKALARSMEQFEFSCIGASMTEDERVISHSLHHFAHLIRNIEEERDRMLDRADEQIIQPLERFRKEHIGAVKEGKKKFDKKTAKFCQTQERTLSLSTKKPESVFQEADAALDMAERDFCQASLEYVFQLQAVQERKKFELVETLLGFVFGWWTFHHTAHDVHADAEPRVRDLQLRIQRTRSNFEETSKQTESLMKKMMEVRQMYKDDTGGEDGGRAGYLFLMEKKAWGTAWVKQYCVWGGGGARTLSLAACSQLGGRWAAEPERVPLRAARPPPEPPERRFCWEALPADHRPPLTLQALSERDRTAWMRAIDAASADAQGTSAPAPPSAPALATAPVSAPASVPVAALDDAGFEFVDLIINTLEARGLDEQGLYRVAGVSSRVTRLLEYARNPRTLGTAPLSERWETKTLTSALKAFLRALPEPLLTRALYARFIAAAQRERAARLAAVRALVSQLPAAHARLARRVVRHLRAVAARARLNLMPPANLAVCFGPTLLRPSQDSVAAILDIKFCNVVVETLIDYYYEIFEETPPPPSPPPPVTPAQPAYNGTIGTSPSCLPHVSRTDTSSRVPGLPHQVALATWARSRSSSAESVSASASASSHSASPPPLASLPALAPQAPLASLSTLALPTSSAPPPLRVRTLYACLGEGAGELSFEPNQVITNVAASGEPGWLRGTLNGTTGLVPENYVEPLP
ncbi:hypothetical protein ACJJTC_015169 [Scirpophaga incertulas]